jgi:hypothetical protein
MMAPQSHGELARSGSAEDCRTPWKHGGNSRVAVFVHFLVNHDHHLVRFQHGRLIHSSLLTAILWLLVRAQPARKAIIHHRHRRRTLTTTPSIRKEDDTTTTSPTTLILDDGTPTLLTAAILANMTPTFMIRMETTIPTVSSVSNLYCAR